MFPRARVVLVTRDYPDVVRSALRNFFAPSEPEVDAILRQYVKSPARMTEGDETVALKYEGIIGANRAMVLRDALEALGLTFDETSLALIGRPTGSA